MLQDTDTHGMAKRFKRMNNAFGWFAFIVAAVTYCVTAEPSVSYWDCPEFIFSAHNLEVGHPPGAPFFLLTANFFSMFAAPEQVAYMVNIMSALLSAGGILFLFWSITHLTRRLIVGRDEVTTMSQTVTILASGMVGALAYTWSDTYWFSAVEAEVYGYSSLFTAVTFWSILKWEESDGSPSSDRWLIFIAYLTGLSIGVHLLNLLCIPAIALVAYYKKYPATNWKGTLLALFLSCVLVGIVLYGIVPGMLKMGGWTELLFVNVFGLSFNTGLMVYVLLLFAVLVAGVVVSVKCGKVSVSVLLLTLTVALLGIPFQGHSAIICLSIGIPVLLALYFAARKFIASLRVYNTIFLCTLMIVVGYSSYALIIIRSNANTPMAQSVANDIFTLTSYINRDQYGSRPLLYGPGFDSELKVNEETGNYEYVETSPVYARVGDRYEFKGYNWDYVYEQNMLFPRMYSSSHAGSYEDWIGGEVTNTVKAKHPEYRSDSDNPDEVKMPTQWDNAKFFMFYQVGYMYMRYLGWNFVGRQNDVQFLGGLEHGNCITGIPLIDDLAYGDQDMLPSNLKENPGRNVYFGIPLILGIIGLVWQYRRGKEGRHQFWVTFTLFFMTGIAIVIYLNQTPSQARARDYSFAASFYAFAIWIGMGVAALVAFITRRLRQADERKRLITGCSVGAVCMLVPLQMLSQTWDDHDRSGRYACRDFAQNMLNSLPDEGYPIIFTSYDNDSYPLWYSQAVEGVRTDARICFAASVGDAESLDQMRCPAYDAPAVPTTWERDYYLKDGGGSITVLPAEATPLIKEYVEQRPEARRLLGDDPFEINSVTRYWVQEAARSDKSAARCEVDSLLAYIRTNGAQVYSDSISVWKDSVVAMKARLDDADEQLCAELSDSIAYFEKRCNDVSNAVSRMSSVGAKCLPAELHIPVDSAAVCESGMMMPENAPIPEYMRIDMASLGSIGESKLVMLDIIANAAWRRPVYMAYTILTEDYYTYLKRFFVIEGMSLRVTPFDWSMHGYDIDELNRGNYPVDIDKAYDNVMRRFRWGGIKEKENYYADEVVREFATYHHELFAKLADAMYKQIVLADAEGRDSRDMARKLIALLVKQQTELPVDRLPVCINDRKEQVTEVCMNLYVREAARKGGDGYLGDELCNTLRQLYVDNLKDVIKFAWEYTEWFKECRLKFGYDEEKHRKILYNALLLHHRGEQCGIGVALSEVSPVAIADIAGYLDADIAAMLDQMLYRTRILSVELGFTAAAVEVLVTAAKEPEIAALGKKHAATLLKLHYEVLKELYKELRLKKMALGDTRRPLWLMGKVLECIDGELVVARNAGVTVDAEYMQLYESCAAECGYQLHP